MMAVNANSRMDVSPVMPSAKAQMNNNMEPGLIEFKGRTYEVDEEDLRQIKGKSPSSKRETKFSVFNQIVSVKKDVVTRYLSNQNQLSSIRESANPLENSNLSTNNA